MNFVLKRALIYTNCL